MNSVRMVLCNGCQRPTVLGGALTNQRDGGGRGGAGRHKELKSGTDTTSEWNQRQARPNGN